MSVVRLRRLQSDYEKVRDYVNRHPRLQLIQSDGSPPERYQLEYRIRSLRQTADELSVVKSHMVEIALPLSYPRLPPQCRMLTPIFHPNIAPHAICIGDHWSPGEPLWSIMARIGEMIAYQSYNTKSPLNGEAARWVEEHLEELPLDAVSMMPEDVGQAPSTAAKPAPPAPPRARSGASQATGSLASPQSHPRVVAGPSPSTSPLIQPPSSSPLLRPPSGSPSLRPPSGSPPLRPPSGSPPLRPPSAGIPVPPAPAGSESWPSCTSVQPPLTPATAPPGAAAVNDSSLPAAPSSSDIACPQCGATLQLRPELAGKQVRCLRCRTVFRIPGP
jgi:ubiquitin-protein ligase